jgi:acyl carrier protein
MDRSDLLERTRRHVGEFLERDVSHLAADTRLDAAAPGMDSLKIYELMMYLEECFEVSFDESSMADVTTLQELVDAIAAAPPAAAAPATTS